MTLWSFNRHLHSVRPCYMRSQALSTRRIFPDCTTRRLAGADKSLNASNDKSANNTNGMQHAALAGLCCIAMPRSARIQHLQAMYDTGHAA